MARPESPSLIKKRKQQRAQRRRLFKIYFWLFFYTFIFSSLVLLSHWPRFEVSKILVKGEQASSVDIITKITSENLVGNHFYLLSKRNLLLLPRRQIKQSIIEQIPLIGQVDIDTKRTGQVNHLFITVHERRPVALWCRLKECYFIDQTGFVFSLAPNFSDNILLKIYSQGVSDPLKTRPLAQADFVLLIKAGDILPDVLMQADILKAEVSKAVVTADKDYEFYITQILDGERREWKLLFDSQDDFAHLLSNLEAALATDDFQQDYLQKNGQLEYIDLRFGNKVFYKFY